MDTSVIPISSNVETNPDNINEPKFAVNDRCFVGDKHVYESTIKDIKRDNEGKSFLLLHEIKFQDEKY